LVLPDVLTVRLNVISNCPPVGGVGEKFVTFNNNEETRTTYHSGIIRNAMYHTDMFATGR
jgi:hypothetical protein